MKRGNDEMFSRLHVNDSEKGWPRGPPRNKMALYEQLTIPSHRFQPDAGSKGIANERAVFFSYQPKQICSQYSNLTTPLTPLSLRKKLDEDDFRVPNLNHSVQSQECGEYGNEMEQERVSPSNPSDVNRRLRLHKFKRTVMQQGKSQTVENSDLSSIEKQADSPLDSQKRSIRSRNLERGESVSEVSVVESVAGPDTTPDDVVGIMGQKHFWRARKAILKQQRVFAVQVFELHRLVKVQKSIAESPHSLVDNSSSIDKPKVLPTPAKETPNVSKHKESSALKTTGKASFSSVQNGVVSSSCGPLNRNPPAPSNSGQWCFNQPQGNQWLIPVLTPSEGLVYKPYPSLVGPPGSNPYCQLPSFPPAGPHGFFPTYGVPVSIQHENLPSMHSHKNRAFRDGSNSLHNDEVVEASRESSPVENSRGSNDTERANLLSLLPTAPSSDDPRSSPARPEPDLLKRVIKAVPHNAGAATESAARIFLSIQEERKQY